jgi:hypothetical protein
MDHSVGRRLEAAAATRGEQQFAPAGLKHRLYRGTLLIEWLASIRAGEDPCT